MNTRKIMLVGAAFGLGSAERHPEQGPQVLRKNGLTERLREAGAEVVDAGDEPEPLNQDPGNDPRLRYISQTLEFSARFGRRVDKAWKQGYMPVVLGGDHSISLTSISVAADHLRKKLGPSAELGVIWVDAHGDINTPDTTPSGNIHGMPVAALLGYGDSRLTSIRGKQPKLKPENVVFIGTRSLDPGERSFIKQHNISCYTMKEIDMLHIGEVCRRALDQVTKNTAGFIISFDLDSCDPAFAPGVGTPVRAGLTQREALLIMELAAEHPKLLSVELVEFGPAQDIDGRTCELGIQLLEAAAGKTIL